MQFPLRRKFTDSDGFPGPPPTWSRMHRSDLPAEVTLLVLPYVGASWRARGGGYWFSRVFAVVVLAVPAAAFTGLDYLILWGEHRRGGYSPMFWFTAALLALGFCWGFAAGLVLDEFPFTWWTRSRQALVRRVGVLLQGLLLVAFLVTTPGMWVAALIDQLRGRPAAERLALADLEDQLAEHAAGHKPAIGARYNEQVSRLAEAYDPAQPRRLPPRDQLPESIKIRQLPGLGTTWYERGPAYWIRRLLIALLYVLALLVTGVAAVGIADGVSNGHTSGRFWTAIAVEAVTNLVFLIYSAISMRRAAANRHYRLKRTIQTMRLVRVMPYIGLVLLVLFVVGAATKIEFLMGLALAPIFLPAALMGCGVMLLLVIEACRPLLSQETRARDLLEEQLRVAVKPARPRA
ncbi:MAG TPA: hypothetical protein VGX23_07040 [Actinocrinis sp.]|nr:hypothetical protein [Actinocrinis sp.]